MANPVHVEILKRSVIEWYLSRSDDIADLRGADLRGVGLEVADLRGANIRDADLRGADLQCADLRNADLRGADLRGADFPRADLREANLAGADLRGADLRGADLQDADLQGADLRGADFRNSHLKDANLRGANLEGVNLEDANIEGVFKLVKYKPIRNSLVKYKPIRGSLVEAALKIPFLRFEPLPYLRFETLPYLLRFETLPYTLKESRLLNLCEMKSGLGKTQFSLLKEALQNLRVGKVLFNPKETMRVGITERIEVRITQDNVANIWESLQGRGFPCVEKIEIGPFMRVRLTGGNNFNVQAMNEIDQVIPESGFTEWAWDVTPLKSGRRKLHLHITVRLKLPDSEENRDYPVLDREIHVLVNLPRTFKDFVMKHWQWIVAGLLAVIAWIIKELGIFSGEGG